MPVQDQVVWAAVNIVSGGQTATYARGQLLPDPVEPGEAETRSVLRTGGAIRTVEVVYTAEELADQVRSRADAGAARAVAHDVDPASASGAQMPGRALAGAPTLEVPGAGPVVLVGPEHAPPARPAAQPAHTVTPPTVGEKDAADKTRAAHTAAHPAGETAADKPRPGPRGSSKG